VPRSQIHDTIEVGTLTDTISCGCASATRHLPVGEPALETALLHVPVFPWRPRARVLKPDAVRENAAPALWDADGVEGLVIGLELWLVILVAAPLIVLVLAVGVFSVELPVVLTLAVLLGVAQFTGLIRWTVVVLDEVTGEGRTERYRNLWRATRRIWAVNHDLGVVRWARA